MHHSVEFPQPGSTAIYRGEPVRIHQHNNDGTALVFSVRKSLRAPLADLQALPECSPFERWQAECILAVTGIAARTPATDAYNAYRAWLTDNEIHESEWPSSEYRFRSMMLRAGYRMTREHYLRPGDTRPYLRILFYVAIKGAQQARAA